MRVIAALLLFAGLSGCVPWTVRPIDDADLAKSTVSKSPAAYVDSIWDGKLVPAILSSATDARTALDRLAGRKEGSGPAYFAVKDSGRVLKVDTASRNGLLLIDVAPFDGKADLSIQIGPVIRGSALRDVTGVIRFSDFTNQIAYADANNALNDRVLKSVLGGVDTAALTRHTVEFAGALDSDSKLVPVQLKDDGVQR